MILQGIFNWAVASIQSVGSWAYQTIADTTTYIVHLVK